MFESIGEITPPCGVPSLVRRRSPSSSTPAFNHLSIPRRMTPFRDSLVEDRAQLMMRDRVEVLAYVDLHHKVLPLPRDRATQRAQRIMSRPLGPEAVRAGQEVLLVDGLQSHHDRSLCHLIFEGRDAQRPL